MLKKVHEDKDDEDKVEVPNPATDARWLKWLHDSGFDTFAKAANGPTNASPNPDQLANDQSEMTYSFNIGDVHFIVINTDTLNTNIDKDTNASTPGGSRTTGSSRTSARRRRTPRSAPFS